MRAAFVGLLIFCLLAAPLYADVIPSRRSAGASGETRVADRVASLGVAATDARVHASALTTDETEFFAAHPERVQVVGAQQGQDMFSGSSNNIWYESWLGAGFFIMGFGAMVFMLTNNE